MKRPHFEAMQNYDLETYIRANNKDMFDLGEVFSSYDEDDIDAAADYRDELIGVAEEIFYNNNKDFIDT